MRPRAFPPPGERTPFRRYLGLVFAFLLATISTLQAQTYCASDGGTGNIVNIDRVQFAGIDNPSGDNNGYGDFTQLEASVQAGQNYAITLDPSGPFFLRYRWRAWVDWNNDGVFAGNELVLQRAGFGQESDVIAVPSGVSAGTKRMRVNMSAFTYRGACSTFGTGEVEDYAVVVSEQCLADAGTLKADKPFLCFNGVDATLRALVETAPVVPSGYELLYVLTSGEGLVIEQAAGVPSFVVTEAGSYTIHTLVYDPNTLDLSIVEFGSTTGFDVNGLLEQGGGSICGALDVAGAQFRVDDPMAGTLSGGGDVCLSGDAVTLTATPDGNSNTPDGYSLAYVMTSGSELTFQQLGGTPSFDVTMGGLYTIHTFVFPSDLDLSVVVPGQTTGGDVLELLGANNICASLDVAGAAFNVTAPMAGTLSGGGDVCLSGDAVTLTATPDGNSNTPDGYSLAYVLTSGTELTIQQLGGAPEFDVTMGGQYTIHTFVFPSDLDLSVVEPGVTTGGDVLELLAANNICASLDVAGAAFNVTAPMAGTLSGGGDVCLSGDAVTLTATPDGNSNTPDGYSLAYVLTSGTELTIQQLGGAPEFDVTMGGLYTIHTFVFPSDLDLSVVEPGVTTGGDVLELLAANNICASLDVAGAQFNVTAPMAGTLSGGGDVCLTGDAVTLTATPDGNSNTPDGYSLAYVLTSGTELTIQQLGGTPEFDVTMGGLYTIHTFVFPSDLDLSAVEPGVTTGVDVLNLLAANNICASLDVAGAAFNVTAPMAGTLSGGGDVCLTGEAVTLTATPDGNSNTPDGYSLAYVLTSGTELTIQQLGGAPEFDVTMGGLYTIHTFVFPSDLDLSVVEPGVTTGVDVLNLLAANNICASLDVAGAQFNVTAPMAGTLSGGGDVCLSGDAVTLTATLDGNSNTPDGYSLAYVLTSGSELTIQQLGGAPEFDVTMGGLYTIHTFVFPSDLDLSVVEPGVTTGVDVLNLLAANDICASLDVAGAAFNVSACDDECLADAGSISPSDFIVCRFGGTATLNGVPAGNAVVPAGYETLYVLTRGFNLVIRGVSSTPQFNVPQLGLYRIHTLVYDPSTLDLSIVVPGQTTGFDVNALLLQGGGDICASLDVQGAPFIVVGPVLCSIFGNFNNGIAPQNMEEFVSVTSAAGMNTASEEAMMRTIEEDAPMSVVSVFPNPTRDFLNLELMIHVETDLEVSVLNTLGQEARPGTSLNLGQGPNRSTLDMSGLPAGAYLLRITAKDKVLTHRFTKVD